MPTPQEVVAVMEAVRSQILQLPGVLAIGVGPKISNGIPTGELAILVMVAKTLPEASIPIAEPYPTRIQGVKTDVSIGTRMLLAGTPNRAQPLVAGELDLPIAVSVREKYAASSGIDVLCI